jgi:hypothetical protein
MWEIDIICSDPGCAEESVVWAKSLEELEQAVCECGCVMVAGTVAVHEPELPVRVRRLIARRARQLTPVR